MGQYCIKDDYLHRTVNATVEENVGDFWHANRIIFSRHTQAPTYALAARFIQAYQCKSVLDVGCGLGHKLTKYIAPLVDQCLGVEQPMTIAQAKKMNPQIRYVPADLEKTGQPPDQQFDMLISSDVIEHLLDPDRLLQYIVEHAKPDSLVVISTPERDVRRGVENRQSPKPEHIREWNKAEFAEYLTDRGFTILEHKNLPAFTLGCSPLMWHERFRLIRKGISLYYNQTVVAHPPARWQND